MGLFVKLQRSFAYRVSKVFPSEMLRWMDAVSDFLDNLAIGGALSIGTMVGLTNSLRAITPVAEVSAIVDGHTSRGDGGGGEFYWDATSVETDNAATIINPTGHVGAGRWIRIYSLIEVAFFGGLPDAKYKSGVNGKWYFDAGLTIEARDTQAQLQAADDFASATASSGGRGGCFLNPGNWYVSTTNGPQNQVVVPKPNVDFYGAGDSSAIRMGAGFNTLAHGGWTGFYQLYTTPVDNVQFRDFLFDANSDFNQFPGPNYGGVANPQNTAVGIQAGAGVIVDNVTVINWAGVFGILIGTFGFPNLLTNARVSRCRLYHCGDDPNQGDSNAIASGATDYIVCDNIIDYTGSAAFPVGSLISTAMECHGTNYAVQRNVVDSSFRFLNMAADSNNNLTHCVVSGNVARNVIAWLTFFEFTAMTIDDLEVCNNVATIRPGVFPYGEAGIDTALGSNLGPIPDGNGFKKVKIHDNTLTLIGTPTVGGNSVGIRLIANMQDVEVYHNLLSGWGYAGIIASGQRGPSVVYTVDAATNIFTSVGSNLFDGWEVTAWHTGAGVIAPPLVQNVVLYVLNPTADPDNFKLSFTRGGPEIDITAAGGGTQSLLLNLLRGLHITDNYCRNVGSYGVSIASTPGETNPDIQRLVVKQNTIVDDTQTPVLSYGVNIAAYTEVTSMVWDNQVQGAVNGNTLFDLAAFPLQEHSFPDETYATVTTPKANVAAVSDASNATIILTNPTQATGAVPLQKSPELAFFGYFWDGAASKQALSTIQGLPDLTNPGLLGVTRIQGNTTRDLFRFTRELATDITTLDGGSSSGGTLGFDDTTKALYFGGVAPSVGYQNLSWDGTNWFFIGIKTIQIGDADTTVNISDGDQFVAPPATFTNNRTTTAGTAGPPFTTETMTFIRRDATANTWAIVNGGPAAGTLFTMPASTLMQVTIAFDGVNWNLSSVQRLV